ncbi:hypothetical protein JOD03_002105 [Chryseomicrobium aureum]|nr:hypothetical protein [Chryseomicrobium aureum]
MSEDIYTYLPQKLSKEEVAIFSRAVQWNNQQTSSPILVSRLFYSGSDNLYDFFDSLGLSDRQILHISQAYTYHCELIPGPSMIIQSTVQNVEWKEKWIKLNVSSRVLAQDEKLLIEGNATYFCEKREGDEWKNGKLHSL